MELLEARLTEFERNRKSRMFSPKQREQVYEKANYFLSKVSEHFDLSPERLLNRENKKRKIIFPKQLCEHQISKENKKIFGREYWNLTAFLFMNLSHATVIHSYKLIEFWKNLNSYEGKAIRGFFSSLEEGYVKPVKILKEEQFNKKEEQFNKTADFVCRTLADYFELEPEDLKKKTQKRKSVFPRQIAQYQIAEENKEIFKKESWSLIARLFDMTDAGVMHSYYKIGAWKNLPTSEGWEIRKALSLFKN